MTELPEIPETLTLLPADKTPLSLPSSENRNNYKQMYRSQWESDPSFRAWLTRYDDNNEFSPGYCKVCECKVLSRYASLKAHAMTRKHLKNLNYRGLDSREDQESTEQLAVVAEETVSTHINKSPKRRYNKDGHTRLESYHVNSDKSSVLKMVPNKRMIQVVDGETGFKIFQETLTKRNVQDPSVVFSEYVAAKHRKYSDYTRSVVEHMIANILFDADMGKYNQPPEQSHVYIISEPHAGTNEHTVSEIYNTG